MIKLKRKQIIIIGSLTLIALIVAVYQSLIIFNSNSKEINDNNLISFFIDGRPVTGNDFPTDKTFSYVECFVNGSLDESVTGVWENNSLTINGFKSKTDCNVYFDSFIVDLDTNMIPIMWHNNQWVKADQTQASVRYRWHNYNAHRWANAVLVSNPAVHRANPIGTPVPEADILAYFVYIPRYRYQLWNVNNQSNDPRVINIEFETRTQKTGGVLNQAGCAIASGHTTSCLQPGVHHDHRGTTNPAHNGEWMTHPAFTFGDSELNGIWVGKFSTSPSNTGVTPCPNNATPQTAVLCNDTTNQPRIKPNVSAWRYIQLANSFANSRWFNTAGHTTYNSHMMKNMDWGAVAYLSQSKYGFAGNNYFGTNLNAKRVYLNNSGGAAEALNVNTRTGCSSGNHNAGPTNDFNTCPHMFPTNGTATNNNNTGASTTGTIYGIYDMVGGLWEQVMGNMVTATGAFNPQNAGTFSPSPPNARYYNAYANDDSTLCVATSQNIGCLSHNRGKLGDATRETLQQFGTDLNSAWYPSSFSFFPSTAHSWFLRGGHNVSGASTGVFAFGRDVGDAYWVTGFRVVMVNG